nr:MAG TPA: hypothetical protein [Caudoviricetes sp.]
MVGKQLHLLKKAQERKTIFSNYTMGRLSAPINLKEQDYERV